MQQKERIHLKAHQIFAREKFEDRPMSPDTWNDLTLRKSLSSGSRSVMVVFLSFVYCQQGINHLAGGGARAYSRRPP